MTLTWTDTARAHLSAIHGYIALNSPQYAQRMVDRIIRRAEQIIQFPMLGPAVAEYGDESIREVLEYPYRIIYKVLVDRIDIAAVIHGARRLPRTLPD
jgi:toxin ParE1/3/4